MAVETVQKDSLLRQLLMDIARLPEDDLSLVAEFVTRLKQAHRSGKTPRPSVAAIRAEAKRRAAEMGDVPREELVQRFIEAMDDIRAEAIAKGVAIEGEWEGD